MNTHLNDDRIELEAAAKVRAFFHREYGMNPTESHASLMENKLVVILVNAWASFGKLLSRRDEGQRILQETLNELHREHGPQLRKMVSRIAGRGVMESFSRVEVQSSSIVVTFVFDHRAPQNEPQKASLIESPEIRLSDEEVHDENRRLFHAHRN